jgi:excisionase family DNA binding protein
VDIDNRTSVLYNEVRNTQPEKHMTTQTNHDDRNESEHLLRVADVMGILNVSRSSVYLLIARGELACLRIGRSVRFRPRQVEEYIARRERILTGQADAGRLASRGRKPK